MEFMERKKMPEKGHKKRGGYLGKNHAPPPSS
jgi:hypothetical protein